MGKEVIELNQCQALDNDGNRCKKKAVSLDNYHGDGEIYRGIGNEKKPDWVCVYLCKEHRVEHDE